MKRNAALFIMLSFLRLHGAGALEIDTGFGVNFGYNYSGLTTTRSSGSHEQGYGVGGIGQYLFVDATYVEGTLNFFFSNTSLKHNESLAAYDGFSGDYNLNGISLGFGLLAKYPFDLGSLQFFPLLGFEANFYIAQSFSKDYNEWDNAKEGDTYGTPSAWNSFWFRVGAGGDYFFSGALYLRGELLLDIKLPSGLDTAYMKNEKFVQAGFSDPQFFGLGVTFRIALGLKISNILGFSPAIRPLPVPKAPKAEGEKAPPAKKTPRAPPKKRRDSNVYVPQD